ncbi:hypothetical protein [Rhodohalobacter sp. 8-1]|uniref:hypothetical protein n=1 Tax=Rhodohalobacter sp. 8-1 TaxID=3131972 RepID=UPI0030EF9A05
MHLRALFLYVLFLLLPVAGFSQVIEEGLSRSGSIYSGIGLGMPVDIHSSNTNGMGLSGVSTYSPFAPSISNPAQWGKSEFSQGQLTLGLTNFRASDNLSTAQNSRFTFESFQFVFPLLRNQLGASISFTPVTRADFARVNRGTLDSDGFDTPVEYITNTIGTGGINRFELGLGYQFNDNISIGYAASAYLSTLSEELTTNFSDLGFQRTGQPPVIDEEITGAGFGNRFGIYTQSDQLFRSNDRLSISGSVNLPVNITTERSFETFRIVEGSNERIRLNNSTAGSDGTLKLPLEFNGGVTYYLNPYHSFSAEYLFQNWNESEFSYNLTEKGYYKDRTKVGLGYQYQPFMDQQSSGFFSNFRYSIGATYDDGHLTIAGQDIETAMLHAGLTIPSARNRSSIDISFNYGVRGTESNSLVKENIWGFKLSLNLAEFMFLQQRFQ